MDIPVNEETRKLIEQQVAAGRFASVEEAVEAMARYWKQQQEGDQPSPAAGATNRPSGLWQGRVKIAEDFEELPDDFKTAFGIPDE